VVEGGGRTEKVRCAPESAERLERREPFPFGALAPFAQRPGDFVQHPAKLASPLDGVKSTLNPWMGFV
jgi:hypothetical protein